MHQIGCCLAHAGKRRGSGAFKQRSGTDCRWGVTLERGSDGLWRLFSARNHHNHELCKDPIEALAGPRLLREGIPAELEQLGEMLGAAGISCSQINRVLQINAQKKGIRATWTYHDVRHRFGPSTEELRLDAENLSKWIHMLQEDHELPGAAQLHCH